MTTYKKRQLTKQEKQAYQGAKMFYFGLLPVTIIALVFSLAFLYQQVENSEMRENLSQFFIYLILTIVSYLSAAYFYVKCNAVETHIAQKKSTIIAFEQTQNISQVRISSNTIVNENSGQQNSELTNLTQKPQKFICKQCNIQCPYRSHHCYKCSCCIQRYDHHCFWIGNCVGRHNHRIFFIFLILQSFTNYFQLKCFFSLSNQLNTTQFINIHWIVWMIIYGMIGMAIGFLLFTTYLMAYHIVIILLGITTWEQMRRERIVYLKYLPKGYNPFSIGWRGNILKFFNDKTRENSPQKSITLQDWSQYLPTFDQASTIKPGFNFIDNQYYSCC